MNLDAATVMQELNRYTTPLSTTTLQALTGISGQRIYGALTLLEAVDKAKQVEGGWVRA